MDDASNPPSGRRAGRAIHAPRTSSRLPLLTTPLIRLARAILTREGRDRAKPYARQRADDLRVYVSEYAYMAGPADLEAFRSGDVSVAFFH